jgi:hypothetical protein
MRVMIESAREKRRIRNPFYRGNREEFPDSFLEGTISF